MGFPTSPSNGCPAFGEKGAPACSRCDARTSASSEFDESGRLVVAVGAGCACGGGIVSTFAPKAVPSRTGNIPERVAGSIWLKVRNVPTSDDESII